MHRVKLHGKRGHVLPRRRYAVIVEADDLLTLSTVVVCPTSRSTFPASFHPEVAIAERFTQVLCEMVGAIDARALGERVGHLSREELRAVEDALLLVLDMACLRRPAARFGTECLRLFKPPARAAGAARSPR